MSNKLMWELFEMLRDLINKIEPNEANTKRLSEWSQAFHADEAGEHDVPPVAHEAIEDDDDEPADDPHEHGAPARSRAAAKRRR